jgi:alkylation response protein AidB-like acyl-CoA dehydrogenase
VWEAVARIDSAAAWNLVMGQVFPAVAAYLPEEGAREIYADGPTTASGAGFPPAVARRVEGGWRITGRVAFASGCHHTAWCLMTALEMDGDAPKLDPATGQPTAFDMVFARQDAQILDTWHTVGMRGTGSCDIAVDDLFVPDRRAAELVPLESPAPGFEGPLYRMFVWGAVLGETTVSVGIAAAAVDRLVELVQTKTPAMQATALRDQQLTHYLLGKAQARVAAARDTLHRATQEAYDEASVSLLSMDAKLRLQLAACFAAEASAEAVRLVNEVAGTSAIRLEHGFERHMRDVHVLTQHATKSSARYVTAGRLIAGLDSDFALLAL